ncbi:hypothetical protein LPB86_20205 [Pedobacter sp. MC2016-14]|uniref:hypothetical protein n=1 Tax=Pedobacter sp. MC2016-14 TaxID=2897327 RepID=UPI001E4ED5D0|nr:hypothetical protein [Pedobacter sp. MC2016-14]MCD0490574.1 hypothetical protein [Pedobacter sp. MC2016-14]
MINYIIPASLCSTKIPARQQHSTSFKLKGVCQRVGIVLNGVQTSQYPANLKPITFNLDPNSFWVGKRSTGAALQVQNPLPTVPVGYLHPCKNDISNLARVRHLLQGFLLEVRDHILPMPSGIYFD